MKHPDNNWELVYEIDNNDEYHVDIEMRFRLVTEIKVNFLEVNDVLNNFKINRKWVETKNIELFMGSESFLHLEHHKN